MSKKQNGGAKGRIIDDAVEIVVDDFMERIARGNQVYFLQTDFMKAYNFLNRGC